MSQLDAALAVYAAKRELHATRASHRALVEADIAAFWRGSRPASLPFGDEDHARAQRIARLMAEQSTIDIVEGHAFDEFCAAADDVLALLPDGAPRAAAMALLAAWPAERDELLGIDCTAQEINTAYRTLMARLFALIDGVARPQFPFLG